MAIRVQRKTFGFHRWITGDFTGESPSPSWHRDCLGSSSSSLSGTTGRATPSRGLVVAGCAVSGTTMSSLELSSPSEAEEESSARRQDPDGEWKKWLVHVSSWGFPVHVKILDDMGSCSNILHCWSIFNTPKLDRVRSIMVNCRPFLQHASMISVPTFWSFWVFLQNRNWFWLRNPWVILNWWTYTFGHFLSFHAVFAVFRLPTVNQ